MERDPKYYDEFMCFLCTTGKSRVGWLKQPEDGQIDEVTYTELCNKQNETHMPHPIIQLT